MRRDWGVTLQVDRLVVDTELGPSEAERLEPMLRAAFEELAKRLEHAPAGRWRNSTRVAVGRLCIDSLAADEMLGPRGAARIAEAFWQQLISEKDAR